MSESGVFISTQVLAKITLATGQEQGIMDDVEVDTEAVDMRSCCKIK